MNKTKTAKAPKANANVVWVGFLFCQLGMPSPPLLPQSTTVKQNTPNKYHTPTINNIAHQPANLLKHCHHNDNTTKPTTSQPFKQEPPPIVDVLLELQQLTHTLSRQSLCQVRPS